MDTELLLTLYKDPTLRLPDIAAALGCGMTSVYRASKRLGLPARYAIPWDAPDPATEELAYLLGAWITDGTLNLRNGQLDFYNTASEFLDYVQECANLYRPGHVKRAVYSSKDPTHKGRANSDRVMIHSLALAKWVAEEFGAKKDRIAPYILSAPPHAAIAFLSAIIDGDGHVSKEGDIRLRGSFDWVLDVPKLCAALNIRCSDPRDIRILPSGRPYRSLNIRRIDFLERGGRCIIPSKQERLISPTYRRVTAIANNSWPCPVCGNPRANPAAKLCRACYNAARKPTVQHCSQCGAPLSRASAKLCRACYNASRRRHSPSP